MDKPCTLQTLQLTNFKRFPSLFINLVSNPTVVFGANGSGKTQLLWAVLIFLRAYNLRLANSKHESSSFSLGDSLYELIAHPHFSRAVDYSSFVHKNSNGKTANIVGTFSNQTNFTLTINANGSLNSDLTNPTPQLAQERARFAFATPTFLFWHPKQEVSGFKDIWTSSQQNLRFLYSTLPEPSKKQIQKHLESLFGITKLYPGEGDKDNYLFVCEQDGTEMEVSLLGAALQKVLTTWILFYKLASVTEKLRVFLIEEPESFLCHGLVSRFFNQLYAEAVRLNVQMMATTNSSIVIECFPPKNRLALASLRPELIPAERHHGAIIDDLGIHLLQPVLLLDGRNDPSFIELLMPNVAAKYQLKTSPSTALTEAFILKYGKEVKVVVLHDLEFFPTAYLDQRIELESGHLPVPVIFWDLPCIESYLILNRLLSGLDGKELFIQYSQLLQSALDFSHGFAQHSKKFKYQDVQIQLAEAQWSTALTEAQNPNPNWETVVKVIHGHNWINYLVKSSTVDEIAICKKSMHRHVQELLQKMEAKIHSAFWLE